MKISTSTPAHYSTRQKSTSPEKNLVLKEGFRFKHAFLKTLEEVDIGNTGNSDIVRYQGSRRMITLIVKSLAKKKSGKYDKCDYCESGSCVLQNYVLVERKEADL